MCIICTGVWRLALAGGIAGCCFWTAMFPADVVKSRVQVDTIIIIMVYTLCICIGE